MGRVSRILHMIFIIMFMFISFRCTHILIVGASLNAVEYFKVTGLQEVYYMEDTGDGKEKNIQKVSGEDENEEKEALILEKFRALLGMESSNTRRPSDDEYENGSPSPAPSPSIVVEAPVPSPAPALVLPIHRHSHSYPPRHHLIPPPPNIQKEDKDKGRVRRILVAVLVSAGATFLVCCVGLLWGCQNFRKQRKRKRSTIMVSVYNTEEGTRGRSKNVSSQNSVKKVTSHSGLDLFYLDSLGIAVESQSFCHEQNSETVNTLSYQSTPYCALHESKESDQKQIKAESENGSTSAIGEIMYIHESPKSIKYEPDDCNFSSCDKIISVEAPSSDDESFHSLCGSHSFDARLSNASARSVSDALEIVSQNVSNVSSCSGTSPLNLSISSLTPDSPSTPVLNLELYSPHAPCYAKQNIPKDPSSSNDQRNFEPLPPPPPPPPPPPLAPSRAHIYPSHPSNYSTMITPKGSSSSTLPNVSSPRNSNSSSGPNQTPTPHRDLPPLPPDPPKPPVGIPLPPCPPSFPKGNGNSLKGPPPPPPQLPQYRPLGKDGAPLAKLKPLHWDKVRAAPDRSMVWDKLRSSSFELDEEMIESLFGYNLQNSMKNDETKSKTPSPSKHVLEPKRLQNITILSKALNVTAEQVCYALLQGDGLCLQQLEALAKMVPTKEEEAKLSSYKGDINELGSAEKFVRALLNIPFAFVRIEAMLYKETFEDEVDHLRKSFLMLEEACKELRSSRLFSKLLEAVLKTGNRMNVGTIRGGARAFKLDALLKLADVKGTDGKTTLFHFVVQEIVRSEGFRVSESIMGKITQKNKHRNIEEREEDYRRMGLDLVSGLSTELCNVKKTATIDLDVIASSVSNLSDGMTKLQHLVHKDLCVDENSGNFVHSMRSFLNYAERNLKELQEDEDRVLLNVREITEYFHGDVSKEESNPLRIFVIVRDFLGMLDRVCKELRSLTVPSSPNPLAPFR